jgi:hypothetical protein
MAFQKSSSEPGYLNVSAERASSIDVTNMVEAIISSTIPQAQMIVW